MKHFRKAVAKDVDARIAKFSIYRLRSLRDKAVLGLVMKRPDDLAPFGWLLPAHILPWLRNPTASADLGAFFHDPERNTSNYLSTWLLAAVLDERHAGTDEVVRYARGISFDATAPSYHRAFAMNVLAARSAAPELHSYAFLRSTVQLTASSFRASTGRVVAQRPCVRSGAVPVEYFGSRRPRVRISPSRQDSLGSTQHAPGPIPGCMAPPPNRFGVEDLGHHRNPCEVYQARGGQRPSGSAYVCGT